jgi:biotin-(acetyl-CoA carboxylase) ligase
MPRGPPRGRRVVVGGGRPISGVVRGIDEDGALLVETADGVERILSGEVTLESTYRAS